MTKDHNLEFLVTAQAYEKSDPYKQTMLLHDTFFVQDETSAKNAFINKFENTHKITKIFSAVSADNA